MVEEIKERKLTVSGSATVEINYSGDVLSTETEDIAESARDEIRNIINQALTEMSKKLLDEHGIDLDFDVEGTDKEDVSDEEGNTIDNEDEEDDED